MSCFLITCSSYHSWDAEQWQSSESQDPWTLTRPLCSSPSWSRWAAGGRWCHGEKRHTGCHSWGALSPRGCMIDWSGEFVSPSWGSHQPLFVSQDTSWIQLKAVTVLTNWWTSLRTPSEYDSSGLPQHFPPPAPQGCWESPQKLWKLPMLGLYSPESMVADVGQETYIGPAISCRQTLTEN